MNKKAKATGLVKPFMAVQIAGKMMPQNRSRTPDAQCCDSINRRNVAWDGLKKLISRLFESSVIKKFAT